MSPTLVFVFGTLKQGFPNFHANRGVRLPGCYITSQRYPFYLVGDRYSPWLIDQPGVGHQVIGQVFGVDATTLEQMDLLERVHEADGYRRSAIEVGSLDPGDTSRMTVFAYLKSPEQFDPFAARLGPLADYTLEHAALYRKRSASR